jgi:6,7-dimethyl-8-ribityllumazine synthase
MSTESGYSVIAAEFNKPLIDGMIDITLEELKANGLPFKRLLRVPGCYEMPLVADFELASPDVFGLIVLGYIERGETLHGEVMGHVVSRSLVELQLTVKKPIGIGIIGPGATPAQAQVRQVACAKSAVYAIKQMADLFKKKYAVA